MEQNVPYKLVSINFFFFQNYENQGQSTKGKEKEREKR